jgi:signal transduction histidine kinase
MQLLQRLEIQEDISAFFFGSLLVNVILSLTAGIIITSRIMKRASRIEKAANQIASGNLKYRIPASVTDDEMRKVENNLNNAFSELEDSFNKIMEFSSDIAHELRTPLTVIKGEIEVALREKREPEEYQIAMSSVLEEMELSRKIIDDMLILVKPESAYRAKPFEDVNISETINSIIEHYKIIADSKNIEIVSEITNELKVKGIESLINLIFTNLIYNAIKFTQEKGTINITLRPEKSNVIFSVSDNGPGIPSEEQEKIFTRFYRMKKENSTGSGLGLAIVKKLCDIHNAEIKVKSGECLGTEFIVEFPL